MDLVLAGAGKAGTAVASMFAAVGAAPKALISRSQESLQRANAIVGAEQTLAADLLSDSASCSEAFQGNILLLLALPDDVLEEAARAVCALREDWSGSCVVHLSGATAIDTLRCFKERGSLTAVFHPCTPIRKIQPSLPSDVVYTFEGDRELGGLFESFVGAWNGTLVEVSGINRALYHCGTLLSAGHLAALLCESAKAIETAGVTPEDSREIMLSVARGVLASLERGTAFEDAVTGPFVRGDSAVIARHMAALDAELPEASGVYQVLGELSKKLIEQRHSK